MRRVRIANFPQLDYPTHEALNTLCTNVVFAGTDMRKILVTSCQAHEGKSFVSMGIMKTLASMGYSVVLVDADLRRSMIASKYGLKFDGDALGLAHYLSHVISVDDVLHETDIPGAYMIPVGHDVANSMQLLNSSRFHELMDELANIADYVIVDTPPVGMIVDASVVAKECDGALIVVSANHATKKELVYAKQQIEKSGCPVIGAVLNMVELHKSSSKYYHRSMYAAYEAQGYYRRSSDEKAGEKADKKRGANAQ